MGSYRSLLDCARAWYPSMPRPASWGDLLISVWQERIDSIIGTTDGHPRLRLQWGPEVMRWRPSRIGEGAYDFPVLWAGFQGSAPIAAPRWVLMERAEPESYAPGWESRRRLVIDGERYDIRGPLPKEYYTLAHVQQVHEDGCCLTTPSDEACWGHYVEPNEEMLEWVREQWRLTLNDSDIQPFVDARLRTAPNSQRDEKNRVERIKSEKQQERIDDLDDTESFWERRPHSVVLTQPKELIHAD